MDDSLLVDLSRLQFAMTTLYHFLFVPLTLGLAPFVALMETLHWRTGQAKYRKLARLFGSLLVINFAMGIVTGIVQEFQFGMNWSVFSRFVGDVFGAPLAMEGLLAFFLESTFLGLWLFGRDRLPRGVHVACIWLFVAGTWASAYFIIVANSWMQHPVGYEIDPLTGNAVLNDIAAVLFQPFAVLAYLHTVLGGLLAASAFVFAVAAYHLKRRQHVEEMRWAWKSAIAMGLIAATCQVFVGDILGVMETQVQPMKIAAGEALWETAGPCAGLAIVAIPDQQARDNIWELDIPCLLSLVATNSLDGIVQGANPLEEQYEETYGPGEYTPNVWIAFYAFRLMMGFGLLASAWMVVAWWRTRKGRLPEGRLFWAISIWVVIGPWLGNMFGWIFTENARQPWVVYNLLKTEDAVSNISEYFLFISLPVFFLLYGAFAVVEFILLRKYAIAGPPEDHVPMAGEPAGSLPKQVV
ncbi:MAG: cytochrome ubiquinol oxidase subunit I [bacterium]